MLTRAMVKALQQARSVSDSEHYDHHQWIALKIKTERARAAFWDQMLQHVVKWGVISIISAVVYACYLGFKLMAARGG